MDPGPHATHDASDAATSRPRPESPPSCVEVALPLPLARSFTYRMPPAAAAETGCVVRVPFGRRRLVGVVERRVPEPARPGLRAVEEVLPEAYRLPPGALRLADWLGDYYGCARGEALALFVPPRPGTRPRRPPFGEAAAAGAEGPELSDAQKRCVDAVAVPLRQGRYASFLLHGITGSGKTEVYLHCIAQALALGRTALVLLPEIALTPQTLLRLQRRFPGRVAPYHSRLSHGERCAVWEAAAAGRVEVVVGARSAVFVPLQRLGLVVVDEEHEPSYKADERPRYHARDVALMRGRLEAVPVLLGSATPSLESYANARRGKHRLLELPLRVAQGSLPSVEVVDRRRRENRGWGILSPPLAAALEETLGRREQAIIFHNRRGFARYLQCRECGEVLQCLRCDISLTYHLKDDRLHCHYCGYRRDVPGECASCRAPTLRPRGTGTQRVEEALQSRFPRARILRLDQDTATARGSMPSILEAFGRGEADILLGTQMVAKGLHFPGVTLVGVVDADAGLHFPDFRAHERAFQLLAQVAGRSGRAGPGRVVLQTFDPEHRVLQRARDHDVLGFLEEELEQRRLLGYPPAQRLAAVTVTASREDLLDRALATLGSRLRELLSPAGVVVLGPARAALPRINRRYRGQLLLKGALKAAGKRAVLDLLDALRAGAKGGRNLDCALDVDPQQLL